MINKKTILITGGARSGKSQLAQDLAAGLGRKVLFVATAEAKDEEMLSRIEAHRKSRPEDWTTLESPTEIGAAIRNNIGDSDTVVIDDITLLVSNILLQSDDLSSGEDAVSQEIEALKESMDDLDINFILVSNEVGSGLVPDNRLGRIYRDCLGRTNRVLAQHVDEVQLLVAGIPVKIK